MTVEARSRVTADVVKCGVPEAAASREVVARVALPAGVCVESGLRQTGYYCDPVPSIEVRAAQDVTQHVVDALLQTLARDVTAATLPMDDWLVDIAREPSGGYVYLELFGGGTDSEIERALACLAWVVAQVASRG